MNTKVLKMPELQALTEVLDFMKTDEGSLTLIIGNECIDRFFGNSSKAIEEQPNHVTEIVLASLSRRLNDMELTPEVEQLFNHVLDLIQTNDLVTCA